MELLQARGTRLVEHDILAGPHRTDGHGRPLAGNAGTEDEQDLGSSRTALILDPARLRVALGVALGEIVFLGMEGSEPAAGPEHEVGLPVDMVVADAYGAKAKLTPAALRPCPWPLSRGRYRASWSPSRS